MYELITAGGWLMVPLILSSIGAVGIVVERFIALRLDKVAPPQLLPLIWQLYRKGQLTPQKVTEIRESSPLGRVLAAGLVNLRHSREVMKESIEESGRQVVLELERFLNALGTIAAITPLIGLLGTVIGMIKVFTAITAQGVGNPAVLAGGISEALITTATGLAVAIPSLMFYRFFRGRVDVLVLKMEEEALKLVEVIHGDREERTGESAA